MCETASHRYYSSRCERLYCVIPSLLVVDNAHGYRSDSGTFCEDDVKINRSGMVVGIKPAYEQPSPFLIKNINQLEDLKVNVGHGNSGVVKKVRLRTSGQVLALKVWFYKSPTSSLRRKCQ